MDETNNIIEIRGLQKIFHTKNGDVTALDGINLSVEKGEIFGIIGLSGAGKSTLVRCINRLETPTGGDIVFDGVSMSALKPKELREIRRSMGMIFQQFNLLMQRNALQNVCFPMLISGVGRAEAEKRAMALLETVGLADRAKSYPAQLSGGQKQRVAIARALAMDPKVLLCDEATSALDPTTTRSILSLIRDINRNLGITIIVITHEMSVIEEICSRVAIIDQSQIAEIGRVEDIFIRPKSAIARRLIFPGGKNEAKFSGRSCVRIVFDGKSSFEPVVANMVLECGTAVNILFADTKNIDGKAYGQILLQLPDDENAKKRIFAYLAGINIDYAEEDYNV